MLSYSHMHIYSSSVVSGSLFLQAFFHRCHLEISVQLWLDEHDAMTQCIQHLVLVPLKDIGDLFQFRLRVHVDGRSDVVGVPGMLRGSSDLE